MLVDIPYLVQHVDVQRLRWDIAALAAGERNALQRTGGYAAAQRYIQNAFLVAGLEGRQHTFTYAGRPGTNLLGWKLGRNPALHPILVSAHYDTVPGSPGADDNASGVAAMLECARVLASAPIQCTVEFVAFDMEERQPEENEGLIGSGAFVRDHASSREYVGVYNLETVGYTSGPGTQSFPPGFQYLFPGVYRHVEERRFSGDSVAVVAQSKSTSLSQRLVMAARYAPGLDVIPVEIPAGMPIPSDVFRSDHASFWAAGIPSVMITDTANFRNPNYHTARDTADTLDYAFLSSVTCALLAAVAEQAA
ncbi:MAG: M20/M25/M40 family metallo-hydrolase [Dehalococcoidia bacterium]|nr:M20/M25/M40 family metallo-hydrolase [Dehalococcoidia bacterium]